MVVVIAIPPVYQSTGTILVESQTIPTDLIPSTAASLIDERIEIIRQRVMTRENLFKIIEKYQAF
jgi:succinoglycan biosynthesis transport protein ExoP